MNPILKRFLAMLATLFAVMTTTFFLLRLMPGGPFDNPKLPAEVIAALNAKYHLSAPVWEQFGYFLQQLLLHGDLGPSLTQEARPVAEILWQGLQVSLPLGVLALLVGSGLGCVLAVWVASHPKRALAPWIERLHVTLLSTPSFVLAGGLVLVFAVGLKWLPVATLESPLHWILPVCTLASVPLTFTFLFLLASLKEVAQQPFVKVKRCLGVPENQLWRTHILGNSTLALLSIAGPMVANLLTGSFVVELMFAIPGLGKYFVTAVVNRDYTVVLGMTLLYTVVLLGMNFITDLLMTLVDPRLRSHGRS